MHAFDYRRVASVDDAKSGLEEGEDVKLLAGGMSLVPVLRHRLAAPTLLLDLNTVPELRRIAVTDDRVILGAMATHYSVSTSAEVQRVIPALAKLAGGIGDPLVRNRGTIGGSLAHNDPAACYPCALLSLGGTVVTDRRRITGDDFITGTFETALEPNEVITSVEFPKPDCAAHIKFANLASRMNIVGVFVSRRAGIVRVGITGSGPHAFRPTAMEDALNRDFRPDAIAGIHVPPDDLVGDIHATVEYRSHLITELTMRAVALCLAG